MPNYTKNLSGLSLSNVAGLYNVSRYTFKKKWLKPIHKKLSPIDPRALTPRQINIIVKHLGEPHKYSGYSFGQLAMIYNVSRYTFKKNWINRLLKKIGPVESRALYPKQIHIILKHLDEPL